MELKVLVVGVIKKDNQILLRKKPDGSPPYKETWYLFSGELKNDEIPEIVIKEAVKKHTGINIRMVKPINWDTEIKEDLDGVIKNFVYLDVECDYIDGELQKGEGIEKLEWVDIDKLAQYDIVPPSRVLFGKLGFLK